MRQTRIKVLVWPIGDLHVASSRYRVHQLLPHLEERGVEIATVPGGKTAARTAIWAIGKAATVDCVVVQKKLLPLPYLRLLAAVNGRIIYDFDDALFAPRSHGEHPAVVALRKRRLDYTLQHARAVVAGNHVLATYARRFSRRVFIIPTTLDVDALPAKQHCDPSVVTVGWVGTAGNLGYVDRLRPAFEQLASRYPGRLRLVTVSNAPMKWQIPGLAVDHVPWSIETETQSILSFDIGIMPLLDDEWSRGKCAFKALQYMAMAIPVVASPIGLNQDLVRQGDCGYLPSCDDDWVRAIQSLMDSSQLRQELGNRGRHFARERCDTSLAVDGCWAAIRAVVAGGSVP